VKRALRLPALVAAALPGSGCIPSNVVATADRLVPPSVAALAWTPAVAPPPAGLYESVEITGEAAVSLRRIYYLFRADGSYTAAALADGVAGAAFQTLDGTWAHSAAGLSLDGAEPVLLEQADQHLRITAPTGTVVLRRSVLQ
jgi:hypothetical protein